MWFPRSTFLDSQVCIHQKYHNLPTSSWTYEYTKDCCSSPCNINFCFYDPSPWNTVSAIQTDPLQLIWRERALRIPSTSFASSSTSKLPFAVSVCSGKGNEPHVAVCIYAKFHELLLVCRMSGSGSISISKHIRTDTCMVSIGVMLLDGWLGKHYTLTHRSKFLRDT